MQQLYIATTTIIAVIMGAFYALKRLTERLDPAEPPLVSSSVPYVGHILGMIKKKADYYVQLHHDSRLPIFSIYMGTSKAYVVNSPDLIKLVQKQPKVFAFPPIAAHFSKTICDASKEAADIIDTFASGKDVDDVDIAAFFKMFGTVLAPGPDLDGMNRSMIEQIAQSMQRLGDIANKPQANSLLLSTWLRHEITLATTNSVYGPLNPFKDPKIEEGFWHFTDDLGGLMVNVLPSVIAPKGNAGRKLVADAFYDYYLKKGHESGSTIARRRYENCIKYQVPLMDIARYEVGGSIAFLVNTTPAAFWMIASIYADSKLLEDCRKELDAVITISKTADGNKRHVVDITAVKSSCPLLASIFTETLRCRGVSTSVRKVMEDTMLGGKYLLKKDNVIMMPGRVLHQDPSLWGDDVQEFEPRRFMKGHGTTKHDPAAFRGFGGGTTLCPGRHFATTEIFAIVAMFVLRYDLEAVDGWKFPETTKTSMASAVMEPDTDIKVKITPRAGFEKDEWAFGLKDSEVVLAIAAEDQAEPTKDDV